MSIVGKLFVIMFILIAFIGGSFYQHISEPQIQGYTSPATDPTVILINGNLTANVPYRGIGLNNQLVMDTLGIGQVVQELPNGTWTIANATVAITSNIGMVTRAAVPGDRIGIITYGIVRNTSFPWASGVPLYLNNTAGVVNATPGTNSIPIGRSLSTNIVFFNPNR